MSRSKKVRADCPSLKDEEPIWEFVYDHVCNLELQNEVDAELFQHYRDENPEIQWSVQQLIDYFNKTMRSSLYKCDLPGNKILSLYQALDIEVTPHVETILEARFSAVLRVNSERLLESFAIFQKNEQSELISYKAHDISSGISDESIKLGMPNNGNESNLQTSPRMIEKLKFSKEFEADIWNYIKLNSAKVSGDTIFSDNFWETMINDLPSIQLKSARLLLCHFRSNMLGQLLQQSLDPQLKLRLYKELRLPMSDFHKEWFLKNEGMQIELTADGLLESWITVDRQIEDLWGENIRIEKMEVTPPPQNRKILTWLPHERSKTSNEPSTSNAPLSFSPRSPSMKNEEFLDVKLRKNRSHSQTRPKITDLVTTGREHAKTLQRVPFYLSDQIFAWKFIYSKMKEALRLNSDPVLPKGIVFWKSFVKETKSEKTATNWCSHFRKQMGPTLQEMPFGREMLLFLYNNIDIEINDQVHKILEKKCNAKIKLTSLRYLSSWEFMDIKREDEHIDDEDCDDLEIEVDEEMGENIEEQEASLNTTLPFNEDMIDIDEEDPRNTSDAITHRGELIDALQENDSNAEDHATASRSERSLAPRDLDQGGAEFHAVEKSLQHRQNKNAPEKESDFGAQMILPHDGDTHNANNFTTECANSQQKRSDESFLKIIQKGSRKRAANTCFPKSATYHESPSKNEKVYNRTIFHINGNTPVLSSPESSSRTFPMSKMVVWKSRKELKKEERLNNDSQRSTLLAIQKVMDNVGDAAIEQIEDAALKAFEEDSLYEVRHALNATNNHLIETVRRSGLKQAERQRILLNAARLTERIVGNIQNNQVHEVRTRLMKTALEAKILGMAKKRDTDKDLRPSVYPDLNASTTGTPTNQT